MLHRLKICREGQKLRRMRDSYRAKAAMKMAAAMKLLNPSPVWDAELVNGGGVTPVLLDAG